MNILIPMAGAGKRFSDKGYKLSKPAIPTIDRRTGKEYPMVVCATMDLPNIKNDGSNLIYVDREFHKKDGIEDKIKQFYPKANFITVKELTEGQACTCLLAKEKINNTEELLIAGCDNGMIINKDKFEKLKKKCDVIVFTYRNNESVLKNPNAYGWVKINEKGIITGISIKKAISNNPINDHAIVATFWFKEGRIFIEAAEKMIAENDRVNNEFYVDSVISHVMKLGYDTRVFEIERYIGWGTPEDYENYQNTILYWKEFLKNSITGD
ncbi:nucleotidyltransferase [Leptotrichia sp. OH3620_COT-345]|uniref:nucleotidyltransferase n=1 Tax=Leptotrichia sp. OH3620_COT-345 TaxID=2491048 RepID=UPI000F648FB2|nr:nucleotidyltransferase [Leptotrichia sp. OH3620_COT-345]RRD40754.1 nucleotidyltransferase [Leptotrichia sp. OH3620_COT-345]